MSDLLENFTNAKVATGDSYKPMLMKIKDIKVVTDDKSLNLSKRTDGLCYIIVTVQTETKHVVTKYQALWTNKNGEIKSPVSKSYVTKDDRKEYKPSTFLYDVAEAIKDTFTTQEERSAWEAMPWTNKDKWLNRKFTMDAKIAGGKDNEFVILLTDDQKFMDGLSYEYKAATGEWCSEKGKERRKFLIDWKYGVSEKEKDTLVNDAAKALSDVTTPVEDNVSDDFPF